MAGMGGHLHAFQEETKIIKNKKNTAGGCLPGAGDAILPRSMRARSPHAFKKKNKIK